jgi:hypothetical protein
MLRDDERVWLIDEGFHGVPEVSILQVEWIVGGFSSGLGLTYDTEFNIDLLVNGRPNDNSFANEMGSGA